MRYSIAKTCHDQAKFRYSTEFQIEVVALKLGKAFVQFVAVPVSFHVGFAEAEGAFCQRIPVCVGIMDLEDISEQGLQSNKL